MGTIPVSRRPSTIVALVSIGAFAAIATCDHVRPSLRFIARPSRTSARNDVPVSFRKPSAFRRARGSAVIRPECSRWSTTSVRMTRCGYPSMRWVTTVPVTAELYEPTRIR